jgi:hypothetical protein
LWLYILLLISFNYRVNIALALPAKGIPAVKMVLIITFFMLIHLIISHIIISDFIISDLLLVVFNFEGNNRLGINVDFEGMKMTTNGKT